MKSILPPGQIVSVAFAVAEVRRAAHLVTERRGSDGAVREICDLLLAHLS